MRSKLKNDFFMKQLLAALLFANICNGQQGISFRDPSMSVDPKTEKIIGDTTLYINARWDEKSKKMVNYASKFHIVQYDYGNPPPYSDQIIRWILCEGFPSQYKEWDVVYKKGLSISGDSPIWFSSVSFICHDHKSLLPKYTYDIMQTLEGIKITQNKDTTEKYFNLYYKK